VSRVLIADDSPHAQRMGERILADEGFQVLAAADAETALLRLSDSDPDVILLDVSLPGRSGYEFTAYLKGQPEHRHRRVVLLGSLLDPVSEEQAARAGADAILQKPFEASALLETLGPLLPPPAPPAAEAPASPTEPAAEQKQAPVSVPGLQTPDAESVRAAVTLALDAAMPALIDELTHMILLALRQRGGLETAGGGQG